MRRDLIISFLIVASAHIGFAMWHSGPTKHAVHEDDAPVVKIDLPPMEQEEQPVQQQENTEAPVIAPPSIADVPTQVPLGAFVTAVEPPPVTGLHAAAISVPITHTHLSGAIFNLADLDQQPEARLQMAPDYPFDMKSNNITGTAVIGFIVDSDGNVQDAHVLTSSGYNELDRAAVEGVMRWTFKPGRKGGRAVNARMQVPIAFKIQSDS
ncbi:MAG: energy transducer TonB [Opitutaceae bacterium]|jgi:protein TonB